MRFSPHAMLGCEEREVLSSTQVRREIRPLNLQQCNTVTM